MKLSKILTEARNGALVSKISVNDSSKVVANSKGELIFSSTLFQKKYLNPREGDEVVPSLNGAKETNISEIKRTIKQHEGLEMSIQIGGLYYSGIIEIDL